MAQERLSMRKITDVLRFKFEAGLSERQIARSCGVARSTVADYLRRFEQAALSWPLPPDLTESELVRQLFPLAIERQRRGRNLPDFSKVQAELRDHQRVNLTIDQLWREYKDVEGYGYSYPQFCLLYRQWKKTQDLPMRQDHKAGEKLFVDYGDGLFITNSLTGEMILTQLFVAVWGASNGTFAEASLSQTLPSWIASHQRALAYFGCVPHIVVPDNLKSGVRKVCLYEPDLNPTYADCAEHYGFAVIPARPLHPRDKAKVEAGVLIAKRWILSVLRHRTFFTLEEMNKAIGELLTQLNERLLRKLKKSRRELFETLDRPNAKPLPPAAYVYAEWAKARVHIDYHIEVDKHYYSVPFRFVHQQVDVRLTPTTIEALLKGERIAAHGRSYVPYGHTTLPDHMPPAHQAYVQWTPERLIAWASKIGVCTARLIKEILATRAHPQQAFRSCLGVIRLAERYPAARMEAAALRALNFKAYSLKSVRSILENGLDHLSASPSTKDAAALTHANVRGRQYYH